LGTDKRERQKEGRRIRLAEAAHDQRRQDRRRRLILFVAVAVVVGGLLVAYSLLSDDNGDEVATDTTDLPTTTAAPTNVPPAPGPGEALTGETPCPQPDGSSARTTSFEAAPPMCIDPARRSTAVFTTNLGEIRVELDTASTPETANNFATLARYHYYDGTAIFRTDQSIEIVQGGAPNTNDTSDPGPGYTIADEGEGFTYQPGQLVMARTPEPDSAGAQFFFVAGPAASSLDADGSYVVFGNVVAGQEIVDQILASHVEDPTTGLGGAPAEPVVIESVTIEES
jgi:cyclophilin family peptidyl-prolyl cis-trans isomerase